MFIHLLVVFNKQVASFSRCKIFLDKMVPYMKQPEGDRNVKYLHDMISLRSEVPVDEPSNGHSV